MANEIQAERCPTTGTVYFLIRNSSGQIYNVNLAAFQAYATASYANYVTAMAQQGSASGYYTGTFPSTIAAGAYAVTVKLQAGSNPAETDVVLAYGDFEWNGAGPIPLSDLATSGQLGQVGPIPVARGVMVQNFPFNLVQTSDGRSPLLSGVCSGQISRDGGAFVALQSGAFTEIGQGAYSLAALTSGDLNAATVMLLITGTNVSGNGVAIPRFFPFVMQKVSGY